MYILPRIFIMPRIIHWQPRPASKIGKHSYTSVTWVDLHVVWMESHIITLYRTVHSKLIVHEWTHVFHFLSSNTYISTEHENVLAFISHGGLLGTLEAIHTATPVIGMPFFYDQFQNIEILIERGIGIRLDYQSLNVDSFQRAINEIINNKKWANIVSLSIKKFTFTYLSFFFIRNWHKLNTIYFIVYFLISTDIERMQ